MIFKIFIFCFLFREDLIHFKNGNYEKIIKDFKESILFYDAIINYAENLFKDKEYKKALRLIKNYEEDFPSYLIPRVLKLKKEIYKKLSEIDYKKILKNLIKNYPMLLEEKELDLIEGLDFYKGKYYFLKNKWKECIPYFENSENNLKNYYIGYSYFKIGDYEKAISELEKINVSDRWYYEKAKILKGLCYKYLCEPFLALKEFFDVSFEYEDLREIAMKEARLIAIENGIYPLNDEFKINFKEKIFMEYSLNSFINIPVNEDFKNEKNIFLLYLVGKSKGDKKFFERIFYIEPLCLFSVKEIGICYEENFEKGDYSENLLILAYLDLKDAFEHYLEKMNDLNEITNTSEKLNEIGKFYYSLKMARKGYKILREQNILCFSKKILFLLFPLPYKDFIFEKAREKNINPYLIYAIIRRESEFYEKAISPKGAIGLMQILPETFKKIDKYKNYSIDSLFNPYINLEAGIEILSSLLDSLQDTLLTIACYNAGIYKVKEWKEKGIFKNEIQFFIDCPYEETRKYIFRVLSDYEVYKKIYQ